jgi:hypothetical protein
VLSPVAEPETAPIRVTDARLRIEAKILPKPDGALTIVLPSLDHLPVKDRTTFFRQTSAEVLRLLAKDGGDDRLA